jgi:hypothetical protein
MNQLFAALPGKKDERRMKLTMNGWWLRVGRRMGLGLCLMGMAMNWSAHAQTVSTTTVQGTVYLANGQTGAGTLVVSWPAFTTANGLAIAADSMTVTIAADGFVSVNLAPNLGATPAGLYYTAVFYLSDGSVNTQYWVVPAAAQVTLAQVQAQVMPAAQALQTVSKAYVDQSIAELSESLLTASGGTMSGPLYLSGDPAQPLQAADKHYVDESLALDLPLTGGAMTGPLTSVELGALYQVDQFPGADFGAKLSACLSGLNTANGGTCDARNFSGTQAMGANLVISTANAAVLLPCATISTANQILVTAGTRNVTLRGCSLHGTSAASGSQGGTVFLYSGTGAMVQVGDPAYAADTMGFHMDNVTINTTASTSASAHGFVAYRTQELDLESLYFLGNSNQTGMTLDGTGNYTGGTFLDNEFTGFQTAVNAIGHQVANPATTDWMNASSFVRLHIDCPTSSGAPISGTYGINLQQGDGNTFNGGDVEGCSTALHLGSNAQNNTIVGLRNENSASQVVADAGSSYNNWITGGTMFTGQLTDNGTRNSFLDTFHRSFNGVNGDWYGSQTDATVTNHKRLGIGLGNERGLLNEIQTDYGYRWIDGYSDAAAGEQFYQIEDLLNNVNRLSIGQYNSGQSSTNNQTVINAAGTGAVVLNGSNNSGTGGVIIGSGGASESTVATISNTGNAQFNGTLQVGGVSQSTGTMTVRNNADAEVDYYLWPGLTASQKGSYTYKDWNGNSQWYMVKDASNNWALNSAIGGLDSFKAYQSTNSGDTYINASNSSGVVRVNYETGSGTGFNIYGGSSSSLYASFTAANAIKFPGLAANSGYNCLQIDNSGYITNTGSACGSGSGSGGSGTVSSGSAGQIAYYAAGGTAVSGLSTVPLTAGGTGAATAPAALTNLGAAPLAGASFTGPISAPVTNNVQTVPSGGNIQAAITAAGADGTVNLTPGAIYTVSSTLTISSSNFTLNFNGACIVTAGTGDGIYITNVVNARAHVTINDPCLSPGAASTGAAIHDALPYGAQGVTINRPAWYQSSGHTVAGGYYWYYGIQVDGDELFTVNGGFGPYGVLQCNSSFCGSGIYNTPGLGYNSAAVGYINNMSLSMGCQGNPVDWQGGNDLHLNSVILQAYNQFGLRVGMNASGASGNITLSGVHNEVGSCTNPALNNTAGAAGYIVNGPGAHLTLLTGTGGGGVWETFPNTDGVSDGTENYAYYEVIHYQGGTNTTQPLPIGATVAAAPTLGGSYSVVVTAPTSPGPTDTCDFLRVDQSVNGRVAPYSGSGINYAIPGEQGVACGSGTYLAFTDNTPTSSLGAYTFHTVSSTYAPALNIWPGTIVLTGTGGQQSTFDGACGSGSVFVEESYSGLNSGPNITCEGPTEDDWSGNKAPAGSPWINRIAGYNYATNEVSAFMLPIGVSGYWTPDTNTKGVINLGTPYGYANGPGDAITIIDSNPFKTLSTTGNRPLADAGDTAIGLDQNHGGLAFRDPASISFYINHLLDGSSYLERLTSTAKSFTVPVTAPSFIGSLTGNVTGNASSATNASEIGGISVSGTPTAGEVLTGTSGTAATWQQPPNLTPAQTNPGDLVCAQAADTSLQNLNITGGACNGTSCTVSAVIGAANYAYRIPGQTFGIMSNGTTGVNGGPYSMVSATSTSITFANTAASGTVASGGTIYRWCENQTTDATSQTQFTKNVFSVPANSAQVGIPLNRKAQIAYTGAGGSANYELGVWYGPTQIAQSYSMIGGYGVTYRLGEASIDIVPQVVGSSGLLSASFQSVLMTSGSTPVYFTNGLSTPTLVNTANAANIALSVAFYPTALGSITLSSGCTVTGSIGQTVLLTAFNNGNSTATATGTLTAANTISGATWVVTNPGQNATSAATSATCGAGTVTSASGTATLTTTLRGAAGNAMDLVSMQ